jgi:hypothetical protein
MTEQNKTITEIIRLSESIKVGCENLKSKTSSIPIDQKALKAWSGFWETQRNIFIISEKFHKGIAVICEKLDRDISELQARNK